MRLMAIAGLGDPGAEDGQVEQDFLPIGVDQSQSRLFTPASPRLTVDDVAAGPGEGASGPQGPPDPLLNLLDGGDDPAPPALGELWPKGGGDPPPPCPPSGRG